MACGGLKPYLVILTEQGKRCLVMEVAPLPLHPLALPLHERYRLFATPAALFSARDTPLCLPKRSFRRVEVVWVLHNGPIRCDEEHLQAHVYACFLT